MDTPNSSRDFPGEYRLDVEDFGPIAKASVDLRPSDGVHWSEQYREVLPGDSGVCAT